MTAASFCDLSIHCLKITASFHVVQSESATAPLKDRGEYTNKHKQAIAI
jgi:hypothetical protein